MTRESVHFQAVRVVRKQPLQDKHSWFPEKRVTFNVYYSCQGKLDETKTSISEHMNQSRKVTVFDGGLTELDAEAPQTYFQYLIYTDCGLLHWLISESREGY